jgi:AraC-like DNA-binding protein
MNGEHGGLLSELPFHNRNLLLIQHYGERASEAALRVGDEGPAQFRREYKRCFRAPPTKDRQVVAAD